VTDRHSRRGDVLDALLRNPVMTARGPAGSLGMTNQTATSALRALLVAGLVREVIGRESFRAFGLWV
jgi:DNA-binding MarR family transcriptional regulator